MWFAFAAVGVISAFGLLLMTALLKGGAGPQPSATGTGAA
jgi:hypothetical protein